MELAQKRFNHLATKAFNPSNPNKYRGYFPMIPGKMSHKQGYDIGPEYPNLPKDQEDNTLLEKTPKLRLPGREAEVDKFYKVVLENRDIVRHAADTIMDLVAEAGGEGPGYFAPMFADDLAMNTFRPIRYPKRISDIPKTAYIEDGRRECRFY